MFVVVEVAKLAKSNKIKPGTCSNVLRESSIWLEHKMERASARASKR